MLHLSWEMGPETPSACRQHWHRVSCALINIGRRQHLHELGRKAVSWLWNSQCKHLLPGQMLCSGLPVQLAASLVFQCYTATQCCPSGCHVLGTCCCWGALLEKNTFCFVSPGLDLGLLVPVRSCSPWAAQPSRRCISGGKCCSPGFRGADVNIPWWNGFMGTFRLWAGAVSLSSLWGEMDTSRKCFIQLQVPCGGICPTRHLGNRPVKYLCYVPTIWCNISLSRDGAWAPVSPAHSWKYFPLFIRGNTQRSGVSMLNWRGVVQERVVCHHLTLLHSTRSKWRWFPSLCLTSVKSIWGKRHSHCLFLCLFFCWESAAEGVLKKPKINHAAWWDSS